MKYSDFHREIENNPEYLEAKEALKLHFALGDAMICARMKRGWSQTELAERVGTKQANISRIEAGLANPTLNLVQRIIQVLNLDIYFAPTLSSTSAKTVTFETRSIPAPNWPVNRTKATTTQTIVNLEEDRK